MQYWIGWLNNRCYETGALFQYMDTFSSYLDFWYKDKNLIRPPYYCHGCYFTSKTSPIYWTATPKPHQTNSNRMNVSSLVIFSQVCTIPRRRNGLYSQYHCFDNRSWHVCIPHPATHIGYIGFKDMTVRHEHFIWQKDSCDTDKYYGQ